VAITRHRVPIQAECYKFGIDLDLSAMRAYVSYGIIGLEIEWSDVLQDTDIGHAAVWLALSVDSRLRRAC
jgi:hypothetical protein